MGYYIIQSDDKLTGNAMESKAIYFARAECEKDDLARSAIQRSLAYLS